MMSWSEIGPVIGHALPGVLVVFAAEPHQHVRDGLAEHVVLCSIPLLERGQSAGSDLVELIRGLARNRSAFAWKSGRM